MCELLVAYTTSRHVTPEAQYRLGDVLVVQEDGYQWGLSELGTDVELAARGFTRWAFVVKVPGEPRATFLELVEENRDIGPASVRGRNLLARRKKTLNVPNLPRPLRNRIEADGQITTTANVVLAVMELRS